MSEAGGGPHGYTYSPDGRWWWDGRNWQPVPAAPPEPSGTGSRWLLAVMILVVVAVTVPIGVAAVVVASRVGHIRPPGPAPSTTYLTDASQPGIERVATLNGLRCGAPQAAMGFGRVPTIRVCHRTSATGVMSVQTIGPDASHISVVTANSLALQPAEEPAALALLQDVVSASVPGPDAAADSGWLSAHFDQSGTSQTTVDGVTLRLMVAGTQRSLVVQPATS